MPDGKPPTDHKTTSEAAVQITRANLHWGTTLGQPATVTYAFRASIPDGYVSTTEHQEGGSFQALTIDQQTTMATALSLWSDLANITFTRVTDPSSTLSNNASILFGSYNSTTDASAAFAQYPGSTDGGATAGDVWLNRNSFGTAAPAPDDRNFMAMVHEIGHALGLQHPGDYNAAPGVAISYNNDALYVEDTNQFTLMSYFEFQDQPETPLLHDIAAIQRLYGANFSTRTGDTVYGFNSNIYGSQSTIYNFVHNDQPNLAIWDAWGNDTLDVSGFNQDQTVDLRPNTFSSVGGQTNNIAMAQAVTNSGGIVVNYIENAIGGAGADTIRGNEIGNRLVGGAGNDTLEGFDGNDLLDQGTGGGGASGGNGDDVIWAGDKADTIDGGGGVDTVNYSRSTGGITILKPDAADPYSGKIVGGWATGDTMVGIEHVIGTAFTDGIELGDGGNYVAAGGGSDSVGGGGGRDSLFGEDGDDILAGGADADYLDGGWGWDTAYFGSAVTINLATGVHSGEAAGDVFLGIEKYSGGAGNDVMIASDAGAASFAGGDGIDALYGGARDDWLQGGKGADTINGGAGSDTVSYADAPGAIIAEMYFTDDSTTDGKIHAGEWGYDSLVSIENVEGSAFDDSLYGDERSNTLWGMGGNDRLEGDAGGTPQGSYDYLLGGAGNDTVVIGTFDSAFGGADVDTASFVGGPVFINYNSNTFQIGGLGFELYEFEIYNGTGGVDTLYGAGHGETVNFGAGDDVVYAQGGDDFIYIDAGTDIMDGGAGRDTMVFTRAMVADWQAGVLDAYIGADAWANWEAIQGSAGDDRIGTNSWGFAVELRGGAGNDVLATGVAGVVGDTLLGEEGNDQLNGGAGADVMRGGAGNDVYVIDTAADVVDESVAGSGGSDTVQAGFSFSLAASATLLGQVENLVLLGGAAINGTGNALANTLMGNSGANTLQGLAGNDVLDGGAGADILRGGAGDDTYVVGSATDVVDESVAGSGGIDTVRAWFGFSLAASARLLGQVENLVLLGGAGINGTGNAAANSLVGNSGANTLQGLAGNDTLRGGAGADRLDGGAGIDTASYYAGTMGVAANLATGVGSGGEAQGDVLIGIENLSGSQGNDSLIGSSGANTLQGWSGADVLRGGAGADRLDGGAGIDTASYYTGTVGVAVNLATGVGSGGEAQGDILIGIETLSGSQGNDSLVGSSGANTLQGWNGADVLRGGAAADRLDGGAGIDTASYYTGTVGVAVKLATGVGSGGEAQGDILIGIENLSGSQGNDSLEGTTGANLLQGWNGNDILLGGRGADMLTGGAGADRFVYAGTVHSLVGSGADRITDFSHAQGDRIDLSLIDPNTIAAGNQAFSFIGAGLYTGVAGQLRTSVAGGVTTIAGDVNGDRASDFHIVLSGAIALVSADFVL
jgi:Ca2+-binding RTX toxin-like protein